jgi:hypothetical protein
VSNGWIPQLTSTWFQDNTSNTFANALEESRNAVFLCTFKWLSN